MEEKGGNMNFINLLNETVKHIIKEGGEVTYKEIIYLKTKGWPPGLNKDMFIKHLQSIIDERIESDSNQALVDLLTFTRRSARKMSLAQKERLGKIIKAIRDSHVVNCKHKNLGITIFMHGGGFTPTIGLPELICTLCGLNVTITSNLTPKNCGLKISSKHIGELSGWAKECFLNREHHCRFSFVEDMLKDPIKAYERAYFKFPDKLRIQIVDYAKLQLVSGT